jgi:hypothetical protein
MLAFQSNISGSVIGIFAMGISHIKNIFKYGPLPMEIASAKKYLTDAMNKGFYAAPRELVNMMTNMWVPYDYSAVVQLLIHASTLGDPKAEHYLRDEIKKHLYQEEVREKCESQRKEENARQTAYENHVRMYCTSFTSVLVGDEASGSVCGRNVGSASAWDGAGWDGAGACWNGVGDGTGDDDGTDSACWNDRDDTDGAGACYDGDDASAYCDGAVGAGWDGASSAVGDDACGSNVGSASAWDGASSAVGASWDGAHCDGVFSAVGASCDGAICDGTGGAFSAVGDGASCDGASSAIGASWDGLNLECQLQDGKVPIPCKATIRKALGDKYGKLTNSTLKAIRSGDLTDDNAMTLLSAWQNHDTPPVLRCLIADIFYMYKRQTELGPLPDFYIPPQKQNHSHQPLERTPKIGEFVVCFICGDRLGCKCTCE